MSYGQFNTFYRKIDGTVKSRYYANGSIKKKVCFERRDSKLYGNNPIYNNYKSVGSEAKSGRNDVRYPECCCTNGSTSRK